MPGNSTGDGQRHILQQIIWILTGNYQDMSNILRQIWQPLVNLLPVSSPLAPSLTPHPPRQGNINANYSSFPKPFTHGAPQRLSSQGFLHHYGSHISWSSLIPFQPLLSFLHYPCQFLDPLGGLHSNLQITRIPLESHRAQS